MKNLLSSVALLMMLIISVSVAQRRQTVEVESVRIKKDLTDMSLISSFFIKETKEEIAEGIVMRNLEFKLKEGYKVYLKSSRRLDDNSNDNDIVVVVSSGKCSTVPFVINIYSDKEAFVSALAEEEKGRGVYRIHIDLYPFSKVILKTSNTSLRSMIWGVFLFMLLSFYIVIPSKTLALSLSKEGIA